MHFHGDPHVGRHILQGLPDDAQLFPGDDEVHGVGHFIRNDRSLEIGTTLEMPLLELLAPSEIESEIAHCTQKISIRLGQVLRGLRARHTKPRFVNDILCARGVVQQTSGVAHELAALGQMQVEAFAI